MCLLPVQLTVTDDSPCYKSFTKGDDMAQALMQAPAGQGADEFRLDGYVALVTGAGRGVGAGAAPADARGRGGRGLGGRAATRRGPSGRGGPGPGGPDRNRPRRCSRAVRASGRTALVIPADLRLDILVNNAGGAMPAASLAPTPAALAPAVHFNVAAPFELTRQATPYLLASGRGSVVSITSRMDRLAARGMVTSGTVKAAF